MDVITTHTNADFDTLASMIGARKLYPKALVVFPGSLEKGLRDSLDELELPCPVYKAKDIELEKVRRLILVDIRSSARIGPFSKLIGKEGVEIHIYDHHPKQGSDIKGSIEVIKGYGSTTTIITHIIREKAIALTPEEATIMMAGIYEDTGTLSFPSTTTADYEAASFLLSSGADLTRVTELLKRELTADEITTLSELIESETTYAVGGVEVTIATVFVDKYSGDVATLAHRLVEIEGTKCLFLLADSGDRVHMVARSSVRQLDAGVVARLVGGGGHAQAASATLKGLTLIQAREKVLEAIKRSIVPRRSAKEIMSAPPITTSAKNSIKDSLSLMRSFNINALPVVSAKKLCGVITRQVASKALHHGLGDMPVGDYMTTEVETIRPDSSIEEISEKVSVHGQRLLPVTEGRALRGVITRSDMIKLLREELSERPSGRHVKKVLTPIMREILPKWAMEILYEAGRTADRLGYRAYAVGGFVRDLVLKTKNLDIDIVIEANGKGDAISFAREFSKDNDLRVKCHERFKTAVVVYPDGFKVDIATARLEYYDRPGALPTVEASSLKLDLYRRDFTINTLALALNKANFGELIDFFGAINDIRSKTIRVLHNLSFIEDPTRALRAVRFSERFGFEIGKHTLNLIKNTVKLNMLERASGARLGDEIKNILEEEHPENILRRLSELGLLSIIDNSLKWNTKTERLFERAREALGWYHLLYKSEKPEQWLVLLLALTDTLSQNLLANVVKKLAISGKKKIAVINKRDEGIRILEKIRLGEIESPSELYFALKPLPLEVILYMMAKAGSEKLRRTLSEYISRLKETKPELKGSDLKRLGVKQGPMMGKLLDELFCGKLDGLFETRSDETAFIRRRLPERSKKKEKKNKDKRRGRSD